MEFQRNLQISHVFLPVRQLACFCHEEHQMRILAMKNNVKSQTTTKKRNQTTTSHPKKEKRDMIDRRRSQREPASSQNNSKSTEQTKIDETKRFASESTRLPKEPRRLKIHVTVSAMCQFFRLRILRHRERCGGQDRKKNPGFENNLGKTCGFDS
jgi:hypothetical protein